MQKNLIKALAGLCLTGLVSIAASATPAKVSIVKGEQGYGVLVNGQPYQVKGAGVSFTDGSNYQALAEAGGNTFRTWSTDNADIALAAAEKHGLMVLMGIDLQKQLHGFDYNDEAAVKKQFEWAKAQVLKYKDHPNLLGWIVANEPNLLFNDDGSLAMVNPKAYQAIAELVDFIHEVDPNHPVTFSFAGVNPDHVKAAMEHASNMDFISVQVYGDLANVGEQYAALGVDKPFMVTEFGPLGHWEVPTTSWGREIEEPSGIKAATFAQRLDTGLTQDKSGLNIGHFAFLWGQKQERTPTWYGMFNQDGSANARVDEMTRFWTGSYPKNRAPLAYEILIQGKPASDSLELDAGKTVEMTLVYGEPEDDKTEYQWRLLKEVDVRSQGGAFEKEPEAVPLDVKLVSSEQINSREWGQVRRVTVNFSVPAQTGDYRVFSYIYDGKGKVGNANFPFMVVK
ncbi:glycoside hydrolase family 2 TIM barrel-domain containing protein [Paraferrimonas sedimenticola]|uniref:Glycoside hydrolase family 2 catalytic domain-containing protein n=1 Tax=Paraferrimonas sedimenticola TaxID=375674 RepID=A0AA37W079_9GAMM|nr:glycoside hydrolase family 2 TIM barrel-domain containing protein [Paraferrimonas sedimenticola]GLP97644.1 hypothetical protein GCM10007895_29510 [Paraferrimonas sedimenticola]